MPFVHEFLKLGERYVELLVGRGYETGIAGGSSSDPILTPTKFPGSAKWDARAPFHELSVQLANEPKR